VVVPVVLVLLQGLLRPVTATDSQGLAAVMPHAYDDDAHQAVVEDEGGPKEKAGEKPSDLIAEAEEDMDRDAEIVNTVQVEVDRLQALWKKVFDNPTGGEGSDISSSKDSKASKNDWSNRQEFQREFSRIQESLLTLMTHMDETKQDLTQAHDAIEQKETLQDLEQLVREGKMGVNYETGELAPAASSNLTSALLNSAAATINAADAGGVDGGGATDVHGGHRTHRAAGEANGHGGGGSVTGSSASSTHQQQEMAAAVSKLQQAADPAVLHLDVELLRDVVLLSVSTALGGFAATVLHLPAACGYMVAGMFIGPSGMNLMTKVAEVETLAQFGSIFLLFGHGMLYCQQYHITNLGGSLSDTFAAGVLILSAIFFLVILAYTCFVGGAQFYQATLVASAVSLSSTTATAHALGANRLRETGYGKTLIELMAVQDLLMAPLLSIPTAVKELLSEHGLVHMLPILACYAAAITGAAMLSKKYMPRIINLRNRAENSLSLDLFILGLVSYCLLMSLLTEWMGLSHEAGALLAGLVLADVPQIGKAVVVMEPLTCLFGGMYLGSLGMILSPLFLIHHAGTIVLCVAAVLLIKIVTVSIGMRALGYSVKASLLGALSMAHISELSLFLVSRAQEYKLISRHVYLMVVATTVVLLILTPFSSHAFKGVDRSEYKVGVHKSPFARWLAAAPSSASAGAVPGRSPQPAVIMHGNGTGTLPYVGGSGASHRRPGGVGGRAGSLEYEGGGQEGMDGGLDDDESGPMIVTEGA
jgi:Kef-type K+ transport system membrane component KefB